ncbi:MAG: glycyl-radical enzyme activating protein [Candidatus Omnitrophota bacterium]
MRPLIFDMARGSSVDGPGIRTVVFFKGCPLRCAWCQNPESQSPEPETVVYPERCIGCGRCAEGCHSLARRTVGEYEPPDRLARLIIRDKVFYRVSSGGVTFSGGEPLLYIDYLSEVAERLKHEEISIAVETCGDFDYDHLNRSLLPFIDLFLFDIKLMDATLHARYTGKSNARILENFGRLLGAGKRVVPRIPLIPGYTADEENLSQIAAFLARHRIRDVELLPYNPSGIEKWGRLGKTPPAPLTPTPLTRADEQRWADVFFRQFDALRHQ